MRHQMYSFLALALLASACKPASTAATETRPASESCPSQDFYTFFKAFASDKTVQRAFTASPVKVEELRSNDMGDHVQTVHVAAADYKGFNVRYKDGAYHFVDYRGEVDSSPLRLSISSEGAGKRFVRYLYGMSEGNSYRFERKSDCWYLTEDPEPPTS